MPDVIVLTEVWINDNECNLYNIDGYQKFTKCNNSYRAGGIIVYVDHRYQDVRCKVDYYSSWIFHC